VEGRSAQGHTLLSNALHPPGKEAKYIQAIIGELRRKFGLNLDPPPSMDRSFGSSGVAKEEG
jgi:hypothetical protein